MGARRSFWCVRLSDSRRNRRCTRASASASKPPWRACNDASSGRKSRSTAAPPSIRSDACSAATHAPPRGSAIRLIGDQILPAGLRLEWSRRAEWDDWSRHSEGCYVLRTNLRDWSSEALWRTDIQLSEAEAAFRINKSELSIRPIWHQREDRVLAHILVCFLAYVLWKTLEQWQSRAGLGNSPRTLLQELAAIPSTDVILSTAAPPGRELRLRCVVRPDRAQAVLLERLGLRLPERLRMPRAARTM